MDGSQRSPTWSCVLRYSKEYNLDGRMVGNVLWPRSWWVQETLHAAKDVSLVKKRPPNSICVAGCWELDEQWWSNEQLENIPKKCPPTQSECPPTQSECPPTQSEPSRLEAADQKLLLKLWNAAGWKLWSHGDAHDITHVGFLWIWHVYSTYTCISATLERSLAAQ